MTLADDAGQQAAITWAMHRHQRLFPTLTGYDGTAKGRAAKAAGCTVHQLEAYMSGELQPTTAQILRALSALYSVPAAELNGAAK